MSAADGAAEGAKAPGTRLIITHMTLENFKSYAGVQQIGPFHKVSSDQCRDQAQDSYVAHFLSGDAEHRSVYAALQGTGCEAAGGVGAIDSGSCPLCPARCMGAGECVVLMGMGDGAMLSLMLAMLAEVFVCRWSQRKWQIERN